jgi:hypothetical protein
MISIPLGRVNVPTAGTDAPLTLTTAQAALLSARGLCAKVEVWPDPANATALLVRQSGVTLASLLKPASGYADAWSTPEVDKNCIDPLQYTLGAATNGDGAFVTLWVL